MVTPGAPSREFLDVFAAATGGRPVSFAEFVDTALYHPAVGYYRRPRRRTGLAPAADFHTSTDLGPLFGELIVAAVRELVGTDALADWTFVEIGAEPGAGALHGVDHPFGRTTTLRLGDPLHLAGRCIVFSNELFDAQPFHRVRWRDGAWREMGVVGTAAGLSEVELPAFSPALAPLAARLPASPPCDGYRVDVPSGAESLGERIAAEPWSGLFLAGDYGRAWTTLTTEFPAGTARAYHRHRQETDLLARPGEQDLTCDVCWDWLAAVLTRHQFANPTLEAQETFLLRHAAAAIEAVVRTSPPGPDPRRSRLQQLLHPALQGQRFQVLHAVRRS